MVQHIFRKQPLIHNNTMRAGKKEERDITECTVYARGLTINCVHKRWRWVPLEDDKDVEVAKLINDIWRLQVSGSTKMNLLEPDVKYEAFFVIKLENDSDIRPETTFTLKPPNKAIQERKVDLNMMPKNVWIRVKIGEFETRESSGEVTYSLANIGTYWKKGLMVESVRFLPIY